MGVGYANRNHIVWKNVSFEMMRWSLFDNGTKMRYEWWEDDGGAIIQHKSSISLEMPTELGKLITPDPINFEIAIGKKMILQVLFTYIILMRISITTIHLM